MSFCNYAIVTVETEILAHYSKEIISDIRDSFVVDDILETIIHNRNNQECDIQSENINGAQNNKEAVVKV